MPADALDEAQVNALVADIAHRHGRIDILVNAVGGSTIIADPAALRKKIRLSRNGRRCCISI
jgi:NAD(P)-dependent dehydrogenase (short-subunit alcohol dehydrogenase family)